MRLRRKTFTAFAVMALVVLASCGQTTSGARRHDEASPAVSASPTVTAPLDGASTLASSTVSQGVITATSEPVGKVQANRHSQQQRYSDRQRVPHRAERSVPRAGPDRSAFVTPRAGRRFAALRRVAAPGGGRRWSSSLQ